MTARDPQIDRKVEDLIQKDQAPVGERAMALIDVIRARHGDKIRALLFYGSSRRAGEQSGKMLDFYVLVDRYSDIYGHGLKRFGAFIAPPGVHYAEADGPGDERLRSKYSIVSLKAFQRRARGGAFESMLWARFAQPTIIVCDDPDLHMELVKTLSRAVQHYLAETAPLLDGEMQPETLWQRSLVESYRSELRPENAEGRAAQIVANDQERYVALARAIYPAGKDGTIGLPPAHALRRNVARIRWFWRRVIGKPMGAFRVVKAFFTFDDGVNYIIEKITSHSGVEITLSERERNHPLLHAPVLAWRLFRKGAFR